MKKIAYLALSAMTLIGVYSCNDRDNNTTKTTNPQNKEKTPEQKLEGTWFREKFSITLNGEKQATDEVLDRCSSQSHWEFGADKKAILNEYEFNEENQRCEKEVKNGTYSIKDGKLTLKYQITNAEEDIPEETYSIKEITDDKLVVEQKIDWNSDGKEDTIIQTFIK